MQRPGTRVGLRAGGGSSAGNIHPEKATSMGRSDSGGRKSGGVLLLPASSAGAISRAKSGLPWHVTGYRHLRGLGFRAVSRPPVQEVEVPLTALPCTITHDIALADTGRRSLPDRSAYSRPSSDEAPHPATTCAGSKAAGSESAACRPAASAAPSEPCSRTGLGVEMPKHRTHRQNMGLSVRALSSWLALKAGCPGAGPQPASASGMPSRCTCCMRW
jgi:hypothetical protein